MNKHCPYCNSPLQVINVNFESYDIYGCEPCDFSELDDDFAEEKMLNEMMFYNYK